MRLPWGAAAYEVRTQKAFEMTLLKCLAAAQENKQPQVIIVHIPADGVPPFYG